MSSISLEKNIYKSYKRNAFVLLSILLLFFFSNFLFDNIGPNKSTEYPQEFMQNGLNITYVEGGLDTNKDQLYIAFSIPFNQIDPLLEFRILAKNDVKTNPYLKTEVVKVFEDYYVGYINLPKGKWDKVAIEISQSESTDSSVNGSATNKILIYRKGLEGNKLTKNYFRQSYYREKIDMEERTIKDIKSEKEEMSSAIERAKKTILGLEDSKESSPDSEQETINSKITEANQIIEQKKIAISNLEKKIEEKNQNKKHYKETLGRMK